MFTSPPLPSGPWGTTLVLTEVVIAFLSLFFFVGPRFSTYFLMRFCFDFGDPKKAPWAPGKFPKASQRGPQEAPDGPQDGFHATPWEKAATLIKHCNLQYEMHVGAFRINRKNSQNRSIWGQNRLLTPKLLPKLSQERPRALQKRPTQKKGPPKRTPKFT